MDKKTEREQLERVWFRDPLRNSGSMSMGVPAAVRRALNWHMNAPLVIRIVGNAMEVRQLDTLKAAGVDLETLTPKRRKKSWKRSQAEEPREGQTYTVEQLPQETEET